MMRSHDRDNTHLSQFVVIYLFIFKNGSPSPHLTNQDAASDLANAHRNLGHLSFQYLGILVLVPDLNDSTDTGRIPIAI